MAESKEKPKIQPLKAKIIEKVMARVRERIPGEQQLGLERFIPGYYAAVATADLADRSVQNLYGAALGHWNFLRRRRPNKTLVRVYNPDYERHGWESTHTIIEIVHDDMPFLVDSVLMAINRRHLTIHLLIHPVIGVLRNERGEMVQPATNGAAERDVLQESLIHVEVDHQSADVDLEAMEKELRRVLDDVRLAVDDWQPMYLRLQEIIQELEIRPPPLEPELIREDLEFLRWLLAEHFLFLGYREYILTREGEETGLSPMAQTGLGILRGDGDSTGFTPLPPKLLELALAPHLLIITKTNTRATVHRSAHLDYVGIKRFNAQGEVIGEYRLLGLYTAVAYTSSPRTIPLLNHKVEEIIRRSRLPPGSHAGKAMVNILETLPRDELFQAPLDDLFHTCMGILEMQERPRIRLFVRLDNYDRFISCLVFVPRDRYTTRLRQCMQNLLVETFQGSSAAFTTLLSESVLARTHFVIHLPGEICTSYCIESLEAQLRELAHSWQDSLHEGLIEQLGEGQGNRLYQRYANAFPAGYRADWSVYTAISDLQHMEALEADHQRAKEQRLEMSFYRPLEAPDQELHFKLFRRGQPIPLSDALPILEHMGLRVIGERPYQIALGDGEPVWIHDFRMVYEQEPGPDPEKVAPLFQETFARVWRGETESDGFNRLVLGAQLSWRETSLLRAYCKYLLQTRIPFSQSYMERTLTDHPELTRQLVKLFHARFDPQRQSHRATHGTRLISAIEDALDQVSNLDDDRILRRFYVAIRATLRSNFFQRGERGAHRPYLSLKFDPTQIPGLPQPRPRFEIFVYSPRLEGVHLRGGAVARGGLRWSDRREDFRTEILGLMKAQIVKNAIIVPAGAKGGFVAKQLPMGGSREALATEVLACYRLFIRGLLDITDNLEADRVRTPSALICYDDDDPYLVVAADKGTATFSDEANELAGQYGFWLGDAFASGGATGYDHKKMGITARGAWESVKRHFRESGKDIQSMPFTAVGIGDMSGDVFGNGMLLSRQLHLVAAFDHRHIFIDPHPDLESSYAERQRLFALPRSSWADYNSALISPGGGIYPRSLKSIELTPEARLALGIDQERLEPTALIRAILSAPVDLLWNGGIGTYIKASDESHESVGDRANEAVRINGSELRCQVVGEGGNLGCTQRGRIEYAGKGGRINTDFIDNSGGVDCSDREVNIKILLDRVVAEGELTVKQRNRLLEEMTEEVAQQVLQDNYRQSLSLSLTEAQAPRLLEEHIQFIHRLEKARRLDRRLEALPDDEELLERQTGEKGLKRPELAVLLCYAKLLLHDELLESKIPDDPGFLDELVSFFPQPLRERFADRIPGHRLRREIIATQVTNEILNRTGATFVHRLQSEAGAEASEVTRAFLFARAVFGLDRLWDAIDSLDNQVPAEVQLQMLLQCNRLAIGGSFWFQRNVSDPIRIEEMVEHFKPGVEQLAELLFTVLAAEDRDREQAQAKVLMEQGVPKELALAITSLDHWLAGLDIVDAATTVETDVESVARLYFLLDDRLALHWLRDQITALSTESHWHNRARSSLREELRRQQAILTSGILQQTSRDLNPEERIESWLGERRKLIERWQQLVADLKGSPVQHFEMLSVALREKGSYLKNLWVI